MTGNANPRFVEALTFAADAHAAVRQGRKGTDFPYVAHPIRVAEILDRFACDDDVVIAGFLHDTIEDAHVSAEDIAAAFGGRVADLVTAVSEPDKSLPWKKRKAHTIGYLQQVQERGVLALAAADKLDNVRAISDTLRHLGEKKTWALFNATKGDQHWYYRSIAGVLLEREPKSSLFRTLDFETQTLFPDTRHATSFFAGKTLGTPHDARAYLADPIKHWRPDYSALELARSWIGAAGLPPSVSRVLATCSAYAQCRLIEGLFEREVELGTRGHASQTDLLALVQLADGYGVIAVEGKAREPFGDVVSKWNKSDGKQARLKDLCKQLGLDLADVGPLYYQLLHRTVSALREARRYGAQEALMLVHSFDPGDTSFEAYEAFAAALGIQNVQLDAITTAVDRDGVALRLGWVKER
ncbi:MAG: HD domain-containing protein [Actinomycetota bacterium]|nr:HD domain-containing protein [Actinomycetota bacterium]